MINLFYPIYLNYITSSKKVSMGIQKNNNNNDYRWEIYNYTLNDQPNRITSVDIYTKQYNLGDEEHYYHKIDDGTPVQLPFGDMANIKDNIIYDECKIFVIDYYMSFYNNYDSYMTKLGYDKIKERFKEIILNKYSCYEICIHNKTQNKYLYSILEYQIMIFGVFNN